MPRKRVTLTGELTITVDVEVGTGDDERVDAYQAAVEKTDVSLTEALKGKTQAWCWDVQSDEVEDAPIEFQDLVVVHEGAQVHFTFIGEGAMGEDFEADRDGDYPVLRFDATETGKSNGDGPAHHDESYATLIDPRGVDRIKLASFALEMARQFHALGDQSFRSLAAKFSNTTTNDVNANKTDGDVFEALRKWRSEEARFNQLPPYIVMTDSTLREIVRAKPATVAGLERVKGVSPARAAKYGEAILKILSGP